MVIHPFSPPILPSDYPHMYSSPPSTSSQTSSSSSRKRKRPETEFFDNNDHILKKQRDEFIIAPLTPTSPPSTLSTLQRLTPPTDHEGPYVPHSQSHNNKNDSNQFPAPSYVAYPWQENIKSHSSDALGSIPDHNRFLRDLHLTARAHQSARKHEDEEMLEEEEEMVSERYSEMNKLLGRRKQHW